MEHSKTPDNTPTMPQSIAPAVPPVQEEEEQSPLQSLVEINCKFLNFVTWEMILVVAIVTIVVIWLKHVFIDSFSINIGLNGTIIGVIFYSIYKVFQNNIDLMRTAYYLRNISRVESSPHFTQEQVDQLIRKLQTDGNLLNIQNTYTILKKMPEQGFFHVSDMDSRLIKSKVGARMRSKRSSVTFFAGILVTLGLIGTFYGLILTITAVSQSMANVGADLKSMIDGLGKPLAGMGVAFSSSLYGLSGSMILGVLNFFGGFAQDRFMENIARWLDEHIPAMNPDLMEALQERTRKAKEAAGETEELGFNKAGSKPQAQAPAASAPAPKAAPMAVGGSKVSVDLQEAYVVLANETHHHLRGLGTHFEKFQTILSQQNDILTNYHTYLGQLTSSQDKLQGQYQEILNLLTQTQNMQNSLQTAQQEHTSNAHNILEMVNQSQKNQTHVAEQTIQAMENGQNMLHSNAQEFSRTINTFNTNVHTLGDLGGKLPEALSQQTVWLEQNQHALTGLQGTLKTLADQNIPAQTRMMGKLLQSLQKALTSFSAKQAPAAPAAPTAVENKVSPMPTQASPSAQTQTKHGK